MKAKTRLEIVWETHEITKINVKGTSLPIIFCQSCQKEIRHLSIAETAAVSNISEMDVFRLTKNGLIHSTETATGRLLICADSVAVSQYIINRKGGD